MSKERMTACLLSVDVHLTTKNILHFDIYISTRAREYERRCSVWMSCKGIVFFTYVGKLPLEKLTSVDGYACLSSFHPRQTQAQSLHVEILKLLIVGKDRIYV